MASLPLQGRRDQDLPVAMPQAWHPYTSRCRGREQKMTITNRSAWRRANLFDFSAGDDNLFGADRYRWSLRFTVINVANKVALYNFLSTLSGTRYVTPRVGTVELGFHF